MFKKYYLLTVIYNGTLFNDFAEGSIADYVVRHSKKKIVVVNSWRISKREYLAMKNTTNHSTTTKEEKT